jgi:hypothetical protein
VEFIGGNIEFHYQEGNNFQTVSGNEFINAAGLDGSVIPTDLKAVPNGRLNYQIDLFSGSKILSVIPDLEEVDKETYEKYNSLFNFVNLNEALDERYKVSPPQSTARIYSYWSYAEGVWAEELLRKNKKAEEFTVLTEELNSNGKTGRIEFRQKHLYKRKLEDYS